MNILHKRVHLNSGDIVEIDCNVQCQIMILTDDNFSNYQNKVSYQFYGRFFKTLPATIRIPYSDMWNIVLDFKGRTITAATSCDINIIQN